MVENDTGRTARQAHLQYGCPAAHALAAPDMSVVLLAVRAFSPMP